MHHSIHNGLDSHDKVEMEAAIYAASSFAEESKAFANGICNKLAELIQGTLCQFVVSCRHSHQIIMKQFTTPPDNKVHL